MKTSVLCIVVVVLLFGGFIFRGGYTQRVVASKSVYAKVDMAKIIRNVAIKAFNEYDFDENGETKLKGASISLSGKRTYKGMPVKYHATFSVEDGKKDLTITVNLLKNYSYRIRRGSYVVLNLRTAKDGNTIVTVSGNVNVYGRCRLFRRAVYRRAYPQVSRGVNSAAFRIKDIIETKEDLDVGKLMSLMIERIMK